MYYHIENVNYLKKYWQLIHITTSTLRFSTVDTTHGIQCDKKCATVPPLFLSRNNLKNKNKNWFNFIYDFFFLNYKIIKHVIGKYINFFLFF